MLVRELFVTFLLASSAAATEFSYSFDDEVTTDDAALLSSGCLSDLLSSDAFVGICEVDWNQVKSVVRPTEANIGFAYIANL